MTGCSLMMSSYCIILLHIKQLLIHKTTLSHFIFWYSNNMWMEDFVIYNFMDAPFRNTGKEL